jgi:hypothetical protein
MADYPCPPPYGPATLRSAVQNAPGVFVELNRLSSREFEYFSGTNPSKKPAEGGLFDGYGAPGEIRTPDHLVRSQVLYPTELRAHG